MTWHVGNPQKSDSRSVFQSQTMGAGSGSVLTQTLDMAASMTARHTTLTAIHGYAHTGRSPMGCSYFTAATTALASIRTTCSSVATETTRLTWCRRGATAPTIRPESVTEHRNSPMPPCVRSGHQPSRVASWQPSSASANRPCPWFVAAGRGLTWSSCEIAAKRLLQDALDFGEPT